MIAKIFKWFTGVGTTFNKPDKPVPETAEPGPESGTERVMQPGKAVVHDATPASHDATPASHDARPASPPTPPEVVPAAPPVVEHAPASHRAPEDDDLDDDADLDLEVDEHEVDEDEVVEAEPEIAHVAPSSSTVPPEPDEIERRRQLVRVLFNDFWSGRDDKPTAFVDRLDEAETYLNERLSASGEPWRLDAGSRKLLGLPPRHARGEGDAARR